MDTARQEALWVLRAQCDDAEALELLLRHIQPSLHRYLTGLVGPSDVDDVLQDVLVLVYRKLGRLETPELFRPWAFRIASRAGFRCLRLKKRWLGSAPDDGLIEEIAAPEAQPTNDLAVGLMQLDGVSPASRAVLALHFQEGMSLPDIAAVLEIPLGTTKSRLAYGLASLRKQIVQNRSR